MSQILCVNRSDLNLKQGFSADIGNPVHQIALMSFHYPRKAAEDDVNLKQIIPYTLACLDGRFLAYRRAKRDDSLSDRWSVGFGGHVEEKSWVEARLREMQEETGLTTENGTFLAVGTVNDDSDHVGKCHFGIVSILMLTSTDGLKFGEEVAEYKWVTKEEALQLPNLEKWSKMTLEGLDRD
ncbi:MAG: NUDIX domain-containing protein [Candidatus Competibacteraceae bacterium]|nr:NUDIX domain-containing protein [Candidatus Competibacteraceae bacterium]